MNIKLLKKILQMNDVQLLYNLKKLLKDFGYKKINNKMPYFVYAEGDIPIMLVAHVDTVHRNPPKNIYFDQEEGIMWSPDGLGADDRAGVYAIIQILKDGYRPHILFTNYEESGGIGATKFASTVLPPLDLKFIIELDRRGFNDCVFYDCDNVNFINFIESFGFKTANGSFSDISFICPIFEVAGVNLSVGYDREHSNFETLNVFWLKNTILNVERILKTKDLQKYEYIEKTNLSNLNNNIKLDICYNCYQLFDKRLLIDIPELHSLYCTNCYEKYISTCRKCNKQFYDSSKTRIYCDDCSK